MLDHINTLEELEKEAIEIQGFLNIAVSDNPEEAVERGNDLAAYMSRASKMLADAKYHKDVAMKASIKSRSFGVSKTIAPSILKQLCEADCEVENFMVNWIEKIYSGSVHQLDWLRTVVSKAKEERRVQSGVSGNYHS